MSSNPDKMMKPDLNPMDEDDRGTRRIGMANIDFVNQASNAPDIGQRGAQFMSINQTKAPQMMPQQLSSKFVWTLDEIPSLPDLCPLERSSTFVPHSSARDVAGRISGVLHERSIEAKYHNDKAKVVCVTEDGVEFRVRLYRGRGIHAHGIIVEVQRRFGASNNFYNETSAILSAAAGEKPMPSLPNKGNLPLPPPVVSDDDEDHYQPADNGSSALKMVWKMLNAPKPDSVFLGLQTLLSLTDSAKMGDSTAREVSNQLMRMDSPVGSKVLSIILDTTGDDDTFKFRPMAMAIVANAMHSITFQLPAVVKEELRPVMLKTLKSADENPRIAVQAARCVECWLPHDEQVYDLQVALEIAQKAGAVRHAGLERQAKKCIDMILA